MIGREGVGKGREKGEGIWKGRGIWKVERDISLNMFVNVTSKVKLGKLF